MARSWLIVYMRLAELQTNCHLRTGCGIVPSLVDVAAQFIWKDISNLWSTTRVMAQPTRRLGASLGYVRICLFCRQNVYLRCDFLRRLHVELYLGYSSTRET